MVKDVYHEAVKAALMKDGWTITHDPFLIRFEEDRAYVDLGAERAIAAEKENIKIAVEVKSFIGLSRLDDLEKAIGQYLLYRSWLSRSEPDRQLYLAISEAVRKRVFERKSAAVLLEDYQIHLIVVDVDHEEILSWEN
ncbi:MAG: hypothetical protein HC853_02280 [Anaerolineae bacterium]|nr:hypothetical protein [Anaerolineae bacterium]